MLDLSSSAPAHRVSSGRKSATIWPAARIFKLMPAGFIGFLALIGPSVAPYSPTRIVGIPQQAPSAEHWFGTDATGFDVFSRVLAGAQIDLALGLGAVVLASLAGALIGLAIGSNEAGPGPAGMLARAASRGLDLLQAIPAIVIGMVLISIFGASLLTLVIALAVILAPNQARLVRTETLRVKGEAYLDAARMAGLPEWRITLAHVLPNASWPALENATAIFGSAIFLTAALGFLGVGLNPPTPEWGSMIAIGAPDAVVGRWWAFAFPALATAFSVIAVSVLGDALFRSQPHHVAPKSRKSEGK